MLAIVLSFIFVFFQTGQPLIDAVHIEDLGPAMLIDLGDGFDSAWFVMNEDASRFLVADKQQFFSVIDDQGAVLLKGTCAIEGEVLTIVDAYFEGEKGFILGSNGLQMGICAFDEEGLTGMVKLRFDHFAEAIWGDEEAVYVQFFGVRSGFNEILELPKDLFVKTAGYSDIGVLNLSAYAPDEDMEAIVRIGRISAAMSLTSSEEGLLKLWENSSGKVLNEMKNGLGIPAVFGIINANASHFLWRDDAREKLYLSDWETESTRLIREIDGEYVQWYFLTNQADIGLGVLVNYEPIVIAYDLESGERYELGEYLDCIRPPDMARLSVDNRRLVIGCDRFIQIWEVGQEGSDS
ncbi:hypothetical protein MASR2M15_20240 [Anaerolineales bacterium]